MWQKLFCSISIAFLPQAAFAHVGYMLSENETINQTGLDFPFILQPFSKPIYPLLMLGTLVSVSFIYLLLKNNNFVTRQIDLMKTRMKSYPEFVPWILRLTLGIALIGAGSSQSLVSPILPDFPQFAFIQILLGFTLLAGFLVVPATYLIFLLFIFALSQNFYLVGNLDFLGATLALLALANSKPGLDNLLGIPFWSPLKRIRAFTPLILRTCVGGAMVFLAVYEKFLNPHLFASVVEKFQMTSLVPVNAAMWTFSAGLVEVVIGLALLIGFQTRLVSVISFIVLTLSLFYFRENAYPHVILFGSLSILFITGGGRFSLDSRSETIKKAHS